MKAVKKVKKEVVDLGTKKEQCKEIFEYIRRNKDGKKIKVGVILGLVDGDVARIGWSKCKMSGLCGDVFDLTKGIELARSRARHETPNAPTPLCIKSQVRKFGARAWRYFQDANTLTMPQ